MNIALGRYAVLRDCSHHTLPFALRRGESIEIKPGVGQPWLVVGTGDQAGRAEKLPKSYLDEAVLLCLAKI